LEYRTKERQVDIYFRMADEVLFEFLHSELVSYVLKNSEKDKKVPSKGPTKFKNVLNWINIKLLIQSFGHFIAC
jgi:hypothetical protein